MTDREHFSHLYEIARLLNATYSLPTVLRDSLKKTAELLHLETGWIWLEEPDGNSVYLAASYNLPPALSKYPERLSGWCFCIEKYLAGNIDKAVNVSEITCTRLKDIQSGTRDLKFHASVPIIVNRHRVGLLNLVSKEKQRLNETELSILNTIGELIGMTVQRTRIQGTAQSTQATPLNADLLRLVEPALEDIEKVTHTAKQSLVVKTVAAKIARLKKDLKHVAEETTSETVRRSEKELHYPSSPLTNRELDVLKEARSGQTNNQIAEKLAITERTVKFHMTSILSKLFANTRTEAVHIALQRGLIS